MLDEATVRKLREWLEPALAYGGGTHTVDDVFEAVGRHEMQLWVADRGCAVTQIVEYPRKRTLHVFAAGGDLDQLLDGLPDLRRWAREQGCETITLSGRRGWERVLKPLGWRPTLVTLEAET